MRSHVRTLVVLALAVALVALFLHNVEPLGVSWRRSAARRPEWLALSLATMFLNLAIRALRWQYLLEPLGPTTFGSAFRATAVGFAASARPAGARRRGHSPVFPGSADAAGSERHMTATGAFATIILERLLDIVTVLVPARVVRVRLRPGPGRASTRAASRW